VKNAKYLSFIFFIVVTSVFSSEKILLTNQENNSYIWSEYIEEQELIPAKEFASIISAKFEWNPIIQEGILKKYKALCFLWPNKEKIILDKEEIVLQSPCQLISGKLFVPFDLIFSFCERVDMRAEFSKEKNKLIFYKKSSGIPPLANTKQGFWHVLKEGETLYRISKNYGIDLSSIISLNRIIDPRFLVPGQMIYIPDIGIQTEKELEIPSLPPETTGPKKPLVEKYGIKKIVLDPGHGGKDSGAIGKSGTKEKDVNLDIAIKLHKELKKRLPNTEIILTRDDDYYVPLVERTALANFKKVDLFISIHANAAFSNSASGFEVFHLSAVASDKHAENIAEFENAVIKKFKEKEIIDYTQKILSDIAQDEFISQSIDLALFIQRQVTSKLDIKNRGIKSAFFWVLRDAKMPAVLIETGFLSNPDEEAKMKELAFKTNLVNALANAIIAYKESYEEKLTKE